MWSGTTLEHRRVYIDVGEDVEVELQVIIYEDDYVVLGLYLHVHFNVDAYCRYCHGSGYIRKGGCRCVCGYGCGREFGCENDFLDMTKEVYMNWNLGVGFDIFMYPSHCIHAPEMYGTPFKLSQANPRTISYRPDQPMVTKRHKYHLTKTNQLVKYINLATR